MEIRNSGSGYYEGKAIAVGGITSNRQNLSLIVIFENP
jgi:hypothetical protein